MENAQTDNSAACGQSRSTVGLGAYRGHYFDFKRGEYYRDSKGRVEFVPASGLSYVGGLTREQRDELDAIIRAYVDGLREAPNVEHNRRPQGVRVDGPVGPHSE